MSTRYRSERTAACSRSFQAWRFICFIELFGLLVFTGLAKPTTVRGGHHMVAVYIDVVVAGAIIAPMGFVVFVRRYRSYAQAMREDRAAHRS